MVAQFEVLVTGPDEEKKGQKPVEAVLRVLDRMLAISRYVRYKRRGYWLTFKFRLFRGPWFLQHHLTPLFAFNGILFTKRDVHWIGTDTSQPRLRITPVVPEYWTDILFQTTEDGDAVAELIGQWWLSPRGYDGLVGLIRRWPEAFAAPLYLVPMAIGFNTDDEFWIGVGAAAFAAVVVGGMALVGWQHAKEQRRWQGDQPPDSADK